MRGHEATVLVHHDRLNDETFVRAFDYSTEKSDRSPYPGIWLCVTRYIVADGSVSRHNLSSDTEPHPGKGDISFTVATY